jgi:hypothetical protein
VPQPDDGPVTPPDADTLGPATIDAINSQASILMKRGIGLMDGGRADMEAALVCFDRALDLRRGLPVDTVPLLRFGLAACWLNRADVLIRLGDAAQAPAALRAYDEGIALLRGLPFGEDPRFPRRLAIAYQNRGLALQAHPSAGDGDAMSAFTNAIATLEDDLSARIPDRQYLLAAVWVNLAKTHASEPSAESWVLAREAARNAVALVADLERHDADAAEVGLKARHVLCQTIAARLSAAAVGDGSIPDDVHEATDLADEGLALVRRWEKAGVPRFRTIAYDLFRFGARVYNLYQPQFLDEFILDNTDEDQSSPQYVESPEMRAAVEEALRLSSRWS